MTELIRATTVKRPAGMWVLWREIVDDYRMYQTKQRTIYRCSTVKRKAGDTLLTTDFHRVRIAEAFLLPADVPLRWPKLESGAYRWLTRDECQALFAEQGVKA